MPKRKVKSSKIPLKDLVAYSASDSDNEEIPCKLSRAKSSTSIRYSTPRNKFAAALAEAGFPVSSEDESVLEVSADKLDDSKYDSYASFLKSHFLESDSENEKKDNTPKHEDVSLDQDDNSTGEPHEKKKLHGKQGADEYSRTFLEAAEQGTRIIVVPAMNAEIISLSHPSSVTLHGYLRVSALLGRASIVGFEVVEGKSVKVFSTEGTALLKVSTVKSPHLSTLVRLRKKLRRLLQKDQDHVLDDFLENIGPSTVVLVLEKCLLPPSLQFLELYFPNAVQTKQVKNQKIVRACPINDRLCTLQETKTFVVTSESEWLAEQINRAISQSVSAESEFGPRIAVYGSKHCGKSSLLRYLINSALNQFPSVYFLDIDPGQTEFTPPGIVSLSKVTEPLLGPPFCHQRKPLKMIFTGSISAEASPPMYIKSVLGLIELFKKRFGKGALFVNTMGWIEGIGDICFKSIVKDLEPTILMEFMSPDVLRELKKVEHPNKAVSFFIPARKPTKFSLFRPKDLRNFALLSYIGKCQKFYMDATYLNAFRPVMVCWDNIAIYVMAKKVPPNRLIEAIQCSVVALCRVNKDLILESDKSEYPRTLIDEPLHECLGFGVVRASDETHHLLYIVTPLTLEELKLVNALIKGNVLLPDEIYMKQPIHNVPLPYTDSSKGVLIRQAVRERSRKSTLETPS